MADGLASLEKEGRILANSQLEKETFFFFFFW
jgi:hypothetical protein